MKRNVGLCALLAVFVPALTGFAAYDDLPSWEAAVGSYELEDFEGVPDQEIPAGGGQIELDGFTIVADGNHGQLEPCNGLCAPKVEGGLFVGDVHGGTSDDGPDFNRFDFDVPITAFALDFFFIEDDYVDLGGEGFFVQREVLDEPMFLGVVLDAPVTGVYVAVDYAFYEADNFRWVNVPEPDTALLIGLGLIGLAVRRR